MPETNERVMQMVRGELAEDPGASNRDMASAADRAEVIDVLTSVDGYVDDVMEGLDTT